MSLPYITKSIAAVPAITYLTFVTTSTSVTRSLRSEQAGGGDAASFLEATLEVSNYLERNNNFEINNNVEISNIWIFFSILRDTELQEIKRLKTSGFCSSLNLGHSGGGIEV